MAPGVNTKCLLKSLASRVLKEEISKLNSERLEPNAVERKRFERVIPKINEDGTERTSDEIKQLTNLYFDVLKFI